MSRVTKAVRAFTAAVAGGLLLSAALTASAQAEPWPIFGAPCNPADLGRQHWSELGPYLSVRPVITDSVAINIAPGTTGTRTDTLQELEVVTRQVTNSAGGEVTASAEGSFLIAKVSASVKATYNYNVVTSGARTTSKTTTSTWNFNEPGYYGLYRGVQRVTGWHQYLQCEHYNDPGRPYAWVIHDLDFEAFTGPEEGTILCTGPATDEPDSTITSIRALARKRLGDC